MKRFTLVLAVLLAVVLCSESRACFNGGGGYGGGYAGAGFQFQQFAAPIPYGGGCNAGFAGAYGAPFAAPFAAPIYAPVLRPRLIFLPRGGFPHHGGGHGGNGRHGFGR